MNIQNSKKIKGINLIHIIMKRVLIKQLNQINNIIFNPKLTKNQDKL